MAVFAQALDDLAADQSGTTEYDDFHGKPPGCDDAKGASELMSGVAVGRR